MQWGRGDAYQRDDGRGVTQQLQRIAVERLLVRVREDLGHRRGHNRTRSEH